MRVIVVCEFSGRVRDAFLRYGHDAISCDIEDTEVPGPHIKDDVRNVDLRKYELMIAHPPCTYLSVASAKYFYGSNGEDRYEKREQALDFVEYLMDAPIERWCIENPVSYISTVLCKPSQTIQPYEFGHVESKKTCLWLKNLPKLQATNYIESHESTAGAWYNKGSGEERRKRRSRTFEGIADAMAKQWGPL